MPDSDNAAAPSQSAKPLQNAMRRTFLRIGLGASIFPITGASCSNTESARLNWTPQQTEGPFYPAHQQADKDVDLTIIQGHTQRAAGEIIHVRGRVLDTNGNPIANAFVEIWQANKWGRYIHHRDPSNAPLDINFQGWGQTNTDANGHYGFKTIIPGAYPAGPGWTRPPHIHFKASGENYYPVTTQMYFPDEELNKEDRILLNLSAADRNMVIAKRQPATQAEPVFIFDIVLRRAG
ncbi:MAG: protocatechuate 3,4-dioxygenase [Gammaproteobacteria bacterium]|nr:protocatechuate 3,4-dioxygenase [Gammaproteobacteria bacterium]